MIEKENKKVNTETTDRLLLIAPQPFYQERGTPMNVRLMATILGNSGYSVDLVVFPTGSKIVIPGVNQVTLPNLLRFNHIPIGFSFKKAFLDCFLFIWCLLLCFKNRYNVIHGIEEGGFIAVLLGKLFRRKSIYDMDSVMSEQLSSNGIQLVIKKLISICEKWSIRNASLIITVCSALTNKAYQEKRSVSVVQIEDIPLEFAFPVEKSLRLKYDIVVEEIGRKKGFWDKNILLYTGNLHKYQGIDLLLQSWQLFIEKQKEYEKYCLVIVGGPEKLKRSYEKEICTIDRKQTVYFVGPRPADEMSSWMAIARGLISPRKDGENTPLKIYTYMASGKPVIATDILTHTQVLTKETAFLAAPFKEAVAEAIYDVFSGNDAAYRKGQAARDLVRMNYSYEVFARKLVGAYSTAGKNK